MEININKNKLYFSEAKIEWDKEVVLKSILGKQSREDYNKNSFYICYSRDRRWALHPKLIRNDPTLTPRGYDVICSSYNEDFWGENGLNNSLRDQGRGTGLDFTVLMS